MADFDFKMDDERRAWNADSVVEAEAREVHAHHLRPSSSRVGQLCYVLAIRNTLEDTLRLRCVML